jgi:hypothetical protein
MNEKFNRRRRDDEQKRRSDLESILGLGEGGALSVQSLDNAIMKHPDSRNMKIYEVKQVAVDEAKDFVLNIADFYLNKRIVKRKYVQEKIKQDISALGQIIFQMKTIEHASIKLLEKIDMGDDNPRNFEVYSTLHGQMSNIAKHLTSMQNVLEESYRKVRLDYDEVMAQRALDGDGDEDEDGQKPVQETTLRVRGTRDLLKGIQSNLKEAEDVNYEDVSDNKHRLTDPYNRPDPLEKTKGMEKKEEEDGGYELDENLF